MVVDAIVTFLSPQQLTWGRQHDLDRFIQVFFANVIDRELKTLMNLLELKFKKLPFLKLDLLWFLAAFKVGLCASCFFLPCSPTVGLIKSFLPFEPILYSVFEQIVINSFAFIWLCFFSLPLPVWSN